MVIICLISSEPGPPNNQPKYFIFIARRIWSYRALYWCIYSVCLSVSLN